MPSDLSIGTALAPPGATSGWRQPGSLAHTRRLGDNAMMASDDSKDLSWLRVPLMSLLDGYRPSRTLAWVSPVAPVVTR